MKMGLFFNQAGFMNVLPSIVRSFPDSRNSDGHRLEKIPFIGL